MSGTALILGASGRFGRHTSEAFWNAGWRVHLFDRAADDLSTAATGADVIVYGWNPTYPDWARDVPHQVAQVIAAAKASGATVLMPGNVYNFGPDAPDVFGPETPHGATNTLGRVRVEMEAAFRASNVPTIVLRAGDFLDDAASGNWFDKVMAPSLRKGVLTYPGDPDAMHAWAWLPDLARAAEQLARIRQDLPRFADIPFAGYTLTARQMAALLEGGLDRPVRVKQMSWLPLQVARPFWNMAGPLLSMRYLWNKPHRLDPEPLGAHLPQFEATPAGEALRIAARAAMAPEASSGPHKPTGVIPRRQPTP